MNENDDGLPKLPSGLQNALGAARRELSPSAADRDRVWQGVKAAAAGTDEPVELAARVHSLDAAREARQAGAQKGKSTPLYVAASAVAIAAGLLGYLGTRSLHSGEVGQGGQAPSAPMSLVVDAGADAAKR